jgi:acyl dehydratase
MAINPKHIGKKYGPFTYAVGLEKMREFAYAISGGVPSSSFRGAVPSSLNPLLHDEKVAHDGPHRSVVAFPTFAVNFAMTAFSEALTDSELDINLMMLVHGEQEFEFHEVIRPGDVMTTTGTITQIYEKASKDFVVLVSESKNQNGALVVRGTWTAVIRQ